MATTYIKSLLDKDARRDLADALTIRDAQNADKLAIIRHYGIKDVSFNTVAFAQSLKEANDAGHTRVTDTQSLLNLLKDRVDDVSSIMMGRGEGLSYEEKEARAALQTHVTFNVRRNKFNADVVAEDLAKVATDLLNDAEDDDHIIVHTNGGPSLRPSDVRMTKRVRVVSFANSLDADSVIHELAAYYEELRTNGRLEQ
jgi:hypothetical protein